MTLGMRMKVFWMKKSLTEREFYANEFDTGAGGKETTWKNLYRQLESLLVFSDPGLELHIDPVCHVRNRYRTVLPYVSNRVRLEDNANDYINASYVSVEAVSRRYILTQGPMENTIAHFWEMVWEQKSTGIVMLCKCKERGRNKCGQYWPTAKSGFVIAGYFMIEYLGCIWRESYCLTSLELNNLKSGESRTLLHYRYVSWPDFGVPDSPTVFLRFLSDVCRSGVMQSSMGPLVVHCSAGIGRSGVFTLTDVCTSMIEAKKSLDTLDVKEVLLHVRRQRLGLVQTAEQLRFVYLSVLAAATSMGLAQSIESLQSEVKEVMESEQKGSLPKLVHVQPASGESAPCLPPVYPHSGLASTVATDPPQPTCGSAMQPPISRSPSISSLYSIASYSSCSADSTYSLTITDDLPARCIIPEEYPASSLSAMSTDASTETLADIVVRSGVKTKRNHKTKRSWFKRLKKRMFGSKKCD